MQNDLSTYADRAHVRRNVDEDEDEDEDEDYYYDTLKDPITLFNSYEEIGIG